ncbi:MAG: 30S ribosomal protein S3 [Candidatus Aenigmatarchaeota archaeon]
MALEKRFVKQGIRDRDVEEFLAKEFDRAGYSHSLIQRTPLSIRITIFASKPGLIIGRGGKNIEMMTRVLKERFGFENPQMDVQEVENSNVDSQIIAKWMASAIERGLKYKRVANIALERVMSSGAAGVRIRIAGKIGGEKGRTEKFSSGYLKYSGEPSESMVDTAYSQANLKLGMVGIQVRIMKERPRELVVPEKFEEEKPVEEAKVVKPEEPKADEAPKEEPKVEEKKKEQVKKKKKAKARKKKVKEEKSEENGDNKEKTNEGNE